MRIFNKMRLGSKSKSPRAVGKDQSQGDNNATKSQEVPVADGNEPRKAYEAVD